MGPEYSLNLSDEDLLLAYPDNEAAVEREVPPALYPGVLAIAFRAPTRSSTPGRRRVGAAPRRIALRVPSVPPLRGCAGPDGCHYNLIILSNVHRPGFAAGNQWLRGEFATIITAEDVGFYKLAENHFRALDATPSASALIAVNCCTWPKARSTRPRLGQPRRVVVYLNQPPP